MPSQQPTNGWQNKQLVKNTLEAAYHTVWNASVPCFVLHHNEHSARARETAMSSIQVVYNNTYCIYIYYNAF